jgi:multidrug efflux pump subunit AcrA (membrane-fusion protein)
MTFVTKEAVPKQHWVTLPTRYVRSSIAIACFLLAGTVVILHLLNVSTSDAVLDGRRVVLRAQISGEVMGNLPKIGSVVNKGDIVALVHAPLSDDRNVLAAQAERVQIEAGIGALDLQRDQLMLMQRQLQSEVTEFNAATIDTVAAQLAAAQANIDVTVSEYKFAHAEADRARLMMRTGGMGQTDIDRRLGDESATQQRLTGAKAELARLTVEASAFAVGINTRDGQNNVPYSRQRLDEIALKRADIANQRATLLARDGSLMAEVDRETKWLASQTQAESLASGQSVVWQRPVAVGTDVSKGDVLVELVDCSDMYVMARIPADKASVIALGEQVDVVIAGVDNAVPGKVRIVRSLVATSDPRGTSASGLAAPGAERLAEVEIAVDGRNIPSIGGNFCGIGSGARVRFSVRSIFSDLWPKF